MTSCFPRSAAVFVVSAGLLISSCGGGHTLPYIANESPWRFVRGDVSGAGSIGGDSYSGLLDVVWERGLKEKPQGPLSLAQGALIYTGSKKRLFFIDPQNGETIAEFKNRSSPQTGGLLIDTLLYNAISPPFNYLDCYRTTDGKKLWRSQVLDISAPLIAYTDNLYALGGDGIVYCLERFSGDLVWEYNVGGKLIAAPALDASFDPPVLWITQSFGKLLALNSADGTLLYERDFDEPLVSTPSVSRDAIYFSGQGGSAFALLRVAGAVSVQSAQESEPISIFASDDVRSDTLRLSDTDTFHVASYQLSAPAWSAPAVSGEFVVFSDNSGNVYCFDSPELEKPLWRRDLNGGLSAAPIIVGDYVIVGLLNARIYALNLHDGQIVSERRLDHEIKYSPISDGEHIYVATGGRTLFCLGKSPHREW
ncbi:MAG: PQQ-binding-like beta-propeller repeat protein [candidate division Zixibacteria bacterium]|nr:PQQ-binding-like beta-propeller repeat protein [candidate division Zixibacteria bacterium]